MKNAAYSTCRHISAAAIFLILSSLLAGCGPEPEYSGSSKAVVVKAAYTFKPPLLTGILDKKWKTANAVKAPVITADGARTNIIVRALYDEDNLYLSIRWKDNTESLDRLWVFHNGLWQRGLVLDPYVKKWRGGRTGDDACMIFFADGEAEKYFRENGLESLKHVGPDRAPALLFPGPGILDVWRWNAQRTNPVRQADDGSITGGGVGPRPDSGGGGPVPNGDRTPMYRSGGSTSHDSRILLAEDAVPSPEGWSDGLGVEEDAYVSREILRPYTGSRGDVQAAGEWKNGWWTVTFRRKLNTGDAADVVFEYGRSILAAAAVMDRAECDRMEYTTPFIIRLLEP